MCTVTEFWILRAALNFGPFKTISVTTYTVASALVFGRGMRVAYALHINLWFSSKMFRQVTQQKNWRKNESIQNSYWQTTQWNIWRILKSLFSPTGNHHCLLYSGFPQPALKPPNLGSHSTTTAPLEAPTLVKAVPLSTICTQKNISVL